MLASLVVRRSLAVTTTLDGVYPQLVLCSRYSVAKGGKPAPKPVASGKTTPPPAKKPAVPPTPATKKPVPPPPATKKPVPPQAGGNKQAAQNAPAKKTPPPPPATPVKGSKSAEIAAEKERAAKLKEKEREKERLAKEKEREKQQKEKEKDKLAREKEKEKEQKEREKEKERAKKQKEKEKEQHEKEKEKQQKLKEKEKAEKIKQENAEKKREEAERKNAMPSRAKSAYLCFMNETRAAIAKENPELPVTAIFAEVAKRWTALPDDKREKYEKLAQQDKVRFEKEIKEFKKKYPDPPKRPASGFLLFVKENYPILKKSQPNVPITEMTKQLSKQWNAFPPEKKKKYEDIFEQDKNRYLKEKEKFDKQQAK